MITLRNAVKHSSGAFIEVLESTCKLTGRKSFNAYMELDGRIWETYSSILSGEVVLHPVVSFPNDTIFEHFHALGYQVTDFPILNSMDVTDFLHLNELLEARGYVWDDDQMTFVPVGCTTIESVFTETVSRPKMPELVSTIGVY